MNNTDVQKCQEWLTTEQNESGHAALTEDEIMKAVSKLENKDDDNINEVAVPSHGKA